MFTRDTATPSPVGSTFAAAENDTGGTTHRPRPATAKPAMATHAVGAVTTPIRPSRPTIAPVRTTWAAPNRRTPKSAMDRLTSIAIWYATYASGATAGELPSSSSRYLVLYVEVAASARYMTPIAAPMTRIGRHGTRLAAAFSSAPLGPAPSSALRYSRGPVNSAAAAPKIQGTAKPAKRERSILLASATQEPPAIPAALHTA